MKPKAARPKPNVQYLKDEGIELSPENTGDDENLRPPPPEFKAEVFRLLSRKADDSRVHPLQHSEAGSDNPDFGALGKDVKRKYSVDFVGKLARYGLTEEQIADVLGQPVEVLRRWAKRDKLLAYVLRQGKAEADRMVAESLFRKALGFSYDEVTFEAGVSKEGLPVSSEKRVTKFIPPDTQAAVFWLTNRQGANWKQVTNLNTSETKKIVIYKELAGLSEEELKKLAEDKN